MFHIHESRRMAENAKRTVSPSGIVSPSNLSWHNEAMHAEAVKLGMTPSKPGLLHDAGSTLACDECAAVYRLYYDREAEPSFTSLSLLACELITARHPDHRENIFLELPAKNPETHCHRVCRIRTS